MLTHQTAMHPSIITFICQMSKILLVSGGTLLLKAKTIFLTTLMYKEGRLLIVCSRIINLGTALTVQVKSPLPSSYKPSKYDCFTYTFES